MNQLLSGYSEAFSSDAYSEPSQACQPNSALVRPRSIGTFQQLVTMKYLRSQLMVRCEGKDECRKIHVPYVDTHIQRTRERGQARVSDYFCQLSV